jgi:acetyltransferase
MATHILDSFFKPRAVAIVGLSRSAIGAPVSVLTSLETLGYQGRVYIINPSVERTATRRAYPKIEDIPEQVDLAIVSVERARVPSVLRDCANCGIRAAIVITQGFADADEEGRRLQEEIRAISKETGLRILGPNTIGVVNSFERFTSSFIEVREDKTPIGQVAQSGLFMMGYHLINNEPAGYCMSIDLGNSSDIGLSEVLEYFEKEPRIKVVQCHLEGVTNGEAFVETASRVSRSKPLIALKAGTTSAGQAAVASHTGAVAGANEVYRAAFRKAGVIQATTAEELRVFSKAFAVYTPPKGKRVAIMSFSGGGAILAIDALERAGLELASLSQKTKDALLHLFPSWASVTNPMDIWMSVAKDFAATFPTVLETLLQDPEVDAVMCIYCSYPLPKYGLYDSSEHIARLADAYRGKPVLCWTYGLDIEGFTRKVEASGAAMVFQSLDDAAQSLARMADYRSRQEKFETPPGTPPVHAAEFATHEKLDSARRAGRSYLFTEGLQILAAYGLKVVPWRFINVEQDPFRTEQDLIRQAAELKYPVCLKAVSPELVHKSDSGGVKLGIRRPEELLETYRSMSRLLPIGAEKSGTTGVLVQEMAPRGKEIMIGMKRDPEFGPCIVFGTGGIYAEVLNDFSFRLAPLNHDEANEMINETKIGQILKGVRGEKAAHIEGIADALVQISRLAQAHPMVSEIDVNPLFVNEHEVSAVDARLILSNDRPEMAAEESPG